MDVYAPSLNVYFDFKPSKWMNDYLFGDLQISDVTYSFLEVMKDNPLLSLLQRNKGSFDIIFSNPQKEEITSMDFSENNPSKSQMLKRMLNLKVNCDNGTKYDFVILDTSPGIRSWSINSLVISDIILLSLKMDHIDIEGTKQMASDVYKSFLDFGAKAYLLLNRTAGFCHPLISNENIDKISKFDFAIIEQSETKERLESYLKMSVISLLPCYCDIQFQSREFLTVIKTPEHPFTNKIDILIEKLNSS